jgi:hypothetical protein
MNRPFAAARMVATNVVMLPREVSAHLPISLSGFSRSYRVSSGETAFFSF